MTCLYTSQKASGKDFSYSNISLCEYPEENFTAQSLLIYGYGAIKEFNESSHFSLIVVFFGLKHFSFVSPKIP